MILRQKKTIPVEYLYSVAGGVSFLLVAMVSARMMLVPIVTPTCEERYKQGVRFSWTRQNGQALATADLQAKLGGRDWGLNESVRMRQIEGAPAPVVLEVDFTVPSEVVEGNKEAARSGMGFTWLPKALQKASAGCLSYSVWVPPDFDYGIGGVLPGLYAEEFAAVPNESGEVTGSKPFSTRIHWRNDGGIDLVMTTQEDLERFVPIESSSVRLGRGRWIRIDQEMVLNTTDDNGIQRVWIDGVLGFERTDIAYRSRLKQTMTGVSVDVHYVTDQMKWAPATKNTRLLLSPLELLLE